MVRRATGGGDGDGVRRPVFALDVTTHSFRLLSHWSQGCGILHYVVLAGKKAVAIRHCTLRCPLLHPSQITGHLFLADSARALSMGNSAMGSDDDE